MISKVSILTLLVARLVVSDIPSSIDSATECKTCPYSLCPNVHIYDRDSLNMTLSCWTEGTEIVGDTTWLKTNDSCYVTQYDIDEHSGDYATDLPYCGKIDPKWSSAKARTRYYSECYFMPYISGTPIKNYKFEIDLDLTCVAKNVTAYASTVMGKNKWYKTKSNCYVHETSLWPVHGENKLDDCGPLELELLPGSHEPDPTPEPTASPVPDPTLAPSPTPAPAPPSNTTLRTTKPTVNHQAHAKNVARAPELQRRFLYNTTIGEEYVNCTSNSAFEDRSHGIIKVYEFNQTVIPQCGTEVQYGTEVDNWHIMLFTTDFCWIKDDECWEQMQEDYLRSTQYPHCEKFLDEST